MDYSKCRRRRGEKCLAMLKMICREGQCWAYTEDPNWLKEYKQALEDYSGRKERRRAKCADPNQD